MRLFLLFLAASCCCCEAANVTGWPCSGGGTPGRESYAYTDSTLSNWNITLKPSGGAFHEVDSWWIVPRGDHLAVMGEGYDIPVQTQIFEVGYDGTILPSVPGKFEERSAPVTNAQGMLFYGQQDPNHDQSLQAFTPDGAPAWKLDVGPASLLSFNGLLYVSTAHLLAIKESSGQVVYNATSSNYAAADIRWLNENTLIVSSYAGIYAVDPSLKKVYWSRPTNRSFNGAIVAVDTNTQRVYALEATFSTVGPIEGVELLTCIDGATGRRIWQSHIPVGAETRFFSNLQVAVVAGLGVAVTGQGPAGINNVTVVGPNGSILWTQRSDHLLIAALPGGRVATISDPFASGIQIVYARVYSPAGVLLTEVPQYYYKYGGYTGNAFLFGGNSTHSAVFTVGAVVDSNDHTQSVFFSSTVLAI